LKNPVIFDDRKLYEAETWCAEQGLGIFPYWKTIKGEE